MTEPVSKSLSGLIAIFLALTIAMMLGALLVVGKSFVLPILIAVISVYVLEAARDALSRFTIARHLPEWASRAVVLLGFLTLVMVLSGVMVSTAGQIVQSLPDYQENLNVLLAQVQIAVGTEKLDWADLWNRFSGSLSLEQFARTALGSISAAAGAVFMVVIYAVFLMVERVGFPKKLAVALPGETGDKVAAILSQINTSVSGYLAVKTLVNAILGVLSFGVLWAFGVDFALFWAVLIALLNYIPYFGSMLGVLFPVVLSLAQFGALQTTLLIALFLGAAQMGVGNFVEPRMVGRKVNMSPFVVLMALTLWSSLWGIAGAILAVPLTSIIAIVLASFAATRPFAVLLAENVAAFEDTDAPHP